MMLNEYEEDEEESYDDYNQYADQMTDTNEEATEVVKVVEKQVDDSKKKAKPSKQGFKSLVSRKRMNSWDMDEVFL